MRAGQHSVRIVEAIHPQQVHAKRPVGSPQLGVHRDGSLKLRDRFPVTPGDDVEMRDGLVQRAVTGVQRHRPRLPRARYTIRQVVHGRPQRECLKPEPRIVSGEHAFEFVFGAYRVVCFKRQSGENQPRLVVARIGFEDLVCDRFGPDIESGEGDPCHTDHRGDVLRVKLQRLVEQRLGFDRVACLKEQLAPADTNVGSTRFRRHCGTKRGVSNGDFAQGPSRLRPDRRLRVDKQSLEADLGGLTVGELQAAAFVDRSGPGRRNRDDPSQSGEASHGCSNRLSTAASSSSNSCSPAK